VFSRATIRLGIGPHSSLFLVFLLTPYLELWKCMTIKRISHLWQKCGLYSAALSTFLSVYVACHCQVHNNEVNKKL